VSYDNNVIYYKYVNTEAAAAKPKISFLSNFSLRGGVGGAANKNDRKFLGFAPREQGARGRDASVIRQNPADFVRNTFELRLIHTARIIRLSADYWRYLLVKIRTYFDEHPDEE